MLYWLSFEHLFTELAQHALMLNTFCDTFDDEANPHGDGSRCAGGAIGGGAGAGAAAGPIK